MSSEEDIETSLEMQHELVFQLQLFRARQPQALLTVHEQVMYVWPETRGKYIFSVLQ